MQENWNEKSVAELRAEAKARGLKGISALRKNELAALLSGGAEAAAPSAASGEMKQPAGRKAKTAKTAEAAKTADAARAAVTEKTVDEAKPAKAEKTLESAKAGKPAEEVRIADAAKRVDDRNSADTMKMTDTAKNIRSESAAASGKEKIPEVSAAESAAAEEPAGNARNGRQRENSGRNDRRSGNRERRENGRENRDNRRTGRENGRDNRENRRDSRENDPENRRDSRENNPDSRDNSRGGREAVPRRNPMNNNVPQTGRTAVRSAGYRSEDGRTGAGRTAENGAGNNRRQPAASDRRNISGNGENNRRNGYDSENNRRNGYDSENNRRNSENNTRREEENRRYTYEEIDQLDNRDTVFMDGWNTGTRSDALAVEDMKQLDSGVTAHGFLEVMPEGYGFIRHENYMPGDDDVYVSHAQIRRFNMRTGDVVSGAIRVKTGTERYAALLYVADINGEHPSVAEHRKNFDDLTPIFPNERIHLEHAGGSLTMRIMDLMSPIGKGQRGMIVSPPKAGKTTLMKDIAGSVKKNHPDMHIIILLIDERPEEVTDIRESIEGDNVEVIYSTFDEQPDHHRRVAEMVLGRAKSLVEHGRDVMILLDSLTRLTRAYNLSVTPSGRTLSGGLDPAALYMPKKFFGAARNIREGGSLTILATALVDTGSRMDDVVFEEFKGTGNMEVVLDRRLSERRIFPAIDIQKSGTRREDLLLTAEEKEAIDTIRRGLSGMRSEDAVEQVLNLFARTKNNHDFVEMAKKIRL